MKPRILMVIDDPKWAFAFSAQDMIKYMPEFNFKIIDYYMKPDNPKHYNNIDLIYLFGNYMMSWMPKDFNFKKSCAGIRAETEIENYKNEKFAGLHVVSQKLLNRIRKRCPNVEQICHGVDINFFTPKINYKIKNKLVLGWAGNSGNPVKNVKILDRVIANRKDVTLKKAEFGENQLTREELRDFYLSLDAYILPSRHEGMSATILEAMACGLPIIATNVGGYIEISNKIKGGYIIDPNDKSINNAIDKLKNSSEDERFNFGMNNRREVCDNWSWEIQGAKFTKFFMRALDKSAKTQMCFSYKWEHLDKYGFGDKQIDFFVRWAVKKYGFLDIKELNEFYASKNNILEVGCGSCFNLHYISKQTKGKIVGVDVSSVAIEKGRKLFKNNRRVKLQQSDLLNIPYKDDSFDLIIADGVLHHTENTKKALFTIYQKLQIGGHLYAYLYNKTGAIREFTNNWIRDKVHKMTPDECVEYCKSITTFGMKLASIKDKISIPEIDILGLPEGEYTVQEIFYYGVMKCFWNDNFSFDENNMNNYDWFYPEWAWRQSKEEVEGWLKELDCEYQFNDANLNGLSILLKRTE